MARPMPCGRASAVLTARSALQRGFSMVELMVALLLTAFVVMVVVALYQNSRETHDHQDELTRLQENVRIGMGLVERTIRQGNYKRIPAARDQNPILIEAFSFQQVQGGDGGDEGNDWVQISFNGSSRFPADPDDPADGAIVDCLGRPMPAGVPVHNRFQLTTDAEGRPWLGCARPGTTTPAVVPLIPDVEAMDVLYGIYADESRTVTNFVPWSSAVEASRVVAIRIALLFRSNRETAPAPSTTSYQLGARTLGPFDDRYLRTAVESTVVIRSTAM